MNNPENLAIKNEQARETGERAIKNEQARETGNQE
jgi:hypothetical protein